LCALPEPVHEDIAREFDLFGKPLAMTKEEEERLKLDDTEIAFFRGRRNFCHDVWLNRFLGSADEGHLPQRLPWPVPAMRSELE
jgi:hypothetical protein